MITGVRFEQLHDGPRFTFTDVSCRGCDSESVEERAPARTQFVFVRSGSFLRQAAGEELFVEAGSVVVFHQDELYRTRHPVQGGDRCSSIGVSEDVLRELVAPLDPALAAADVLRLPSACHEASSELFLEHARILQDLRQGRLEEHAFDEELQHLVTGYLAETLERSSTRTGRIENTAIHRELAQRARELLAGCFRERVPLTDIARALDVSVFHLCRVFRAQVGLSLHRYRTRLRLSSAIELLDDTSVDLAQLALDLGFSSHSHFTSSFRREFHSTPGAFRSPRRSRRKPVPRPGAGAAGSP
jgi:AraC family transcriptional regulator